MPDITVVMPVFNGAAYIGQAIESVLAQTYQDFELIVVDDGSTDGTKATIARFEGRVACVSQPNGGPSSARNHGLSLASGEKIAFLDADDTWEPDFLSTASKALGHLDRAFVGVCTGWLFVNHEGRSLDHSRVMPRGALGLRELLTGSLFPIHAALTRRSAIVAGGGFDAEISAMEDWDLWLRLAADGGRFQTVADCLARYRLHGTSNSGDPVRMRAGRMRALDKLFARPDLTSDVRAHEPRARAEAFVQSGAALCGAGREADGLQDVARAVRLYPAVLEEEEPYYALVCADQPVGFKATASPFDLARAERRILEAVDMGTRELDHPDRSLRRAALGRAYRVLARFASLQHKTRRTCRYLARATAADLRGTSPGASARTVLRSLAGPRSAPRRRFAT